MAKKTDGSGTIYRRKDPATGEFTGPWLVKIRVNGKPIYSSSHSFDYEDAKKHRNRLLAQKVRGEITGGAPDKVTVGELLNNLLKADVQPMTTKIRTYVVEANLRPYFGAIRAAKLTTAKMRDYRATRRKEDATDATVNRELALVRTAFHMGRKETPPTVLNVPYFPMLKERTIRQGFLEDAQYTTLRDELPSELRPLFVVGYTTGARLGELLRIRWEQVDFEAGEIILRTGETKNEDPRTLPFMADMRAYLEAAKADRDPNYPNCPWVFSRNGARIKDFRWAWEEACKRAEVPGLLFHDLRRTAVRNLRRAGVPQVVRMKISGHKTDSMERRYNIVDGGDLAQATVLMASRATTTTPASK